MIHSKYEAVQWLRRKLDRYALDEACLRSGLQTSYLLLGVGDFESVAWQGTLGQSAYPSLTKVCARPIQRLARQRVPKSVQFRTNALRTIPSIDSYRRAAQRTTRGA